MFDDVTQYSLRLRCTCQRSPNRLAIGTQGVAYARLDKPDKVLIAAAIEHFQCMS